MSRPVRYNGISSNTRQWVRRKHGGGSLAGTCAGKNAGVDCLVEPRATSADVFRRWECRSDKAERQDVSPPRLDLHDSRAGAVRACARRRLPANSRYAPEKRSLLEHRCARPSLSGQYASSRGGECRLPVVLGERLFCQRIYASQWRRPVDDSSRRLSWFVVKPGRAEAELPCEVSGRQQANTSGIR